MHSSVMITSDLLQQVGLPAVLEACHCRTPQGSRLKNAVRFYNDQSREELEKELAAISRLTVLITEKHPQIVEALTQLHDCVNYAEPSAVWKRAAYWMTRNSLSSKVPS
jgi:hypothetical protein